MLACQVEAEPTAATPCPTLPLVAQQTWVGALVCREQRFAAGGDGRAEDDWIANSRFRAVVRHPNASLSLPGLGGGTIVDAAPWGASDALYEAAPLLGGGWLDVAEHEVIGDRLVLRGRVRALPDRPEIEAEGELREVAWRVQPDDPWLHLEGADGLWLHPSTHLDLLDGWLVGDQVVYGHDGVIEQDLGGALRLTGLTGLLIATPQEAWAHRPGPHATLGGLAPDAEQVRLYRGAAWVGTVPVDETGAWSTVAPADVDGVQAWADGRAPSARAPAGEAVNLTLGAAGTAQLQLGWPAGRPRKVRARWTDGGQRAGEALIAPEGGTLRLGAGAFDLRLSAGPAFRERELRVEIGADEVVTVRATLQAAIDPGGRVLATFDWPGARSRTQRATGPERLRAAIGEGFEYVVSSAHDDVDAPTAYLDDAAWVRWESAARLTTAPWSITAWPWREDLRKSGHGAPRVQPADPLASHELAWGGAGSRRRTRVDLAWLQEVQAPPWSVQPRPAFVSLPSPGFPPHRAWSTWFAWLDAGVYLLPAGPSHWLDVGFPLNYGPVELDRALNYGAFCTGTGALLDVWIDGYGPGSLLPPPTPPPIDTGPTAESGLQAAPDPTPVDPPTPDTRHVALRLQPGATTVRHVTLYTAQLGAVQTWDTPAGAWVWEGDLVVGSWVVALGWSDTATDWVVTSPVWVTPPLSDLPAESTP